MGEELYALPGRGTDSRSQALLRVLLLWALCETVALQLLTQAVARAFGFDPELGAPVYRLPAAHAGAARAAGAGSLALALGILALARDRRQALFFAPLGVLLLLASAGPLYPPLALGAWLREFGADPELAAFWGRVRLLFQALLAGGAGGLALALARTLRRLGRAPETHGSAAWAGRREIEAAGLLGREGIVLGIWREQGRRERYLRDGGPSNVYVQGPPGSGKGAGIVIPTLLTWPGSVLVHDAKGELWEKSAGWRRAAGHRCLRLDPTEKAATAARFNPLAEIRPGRHEVGDAQNLAAVLVDPHGAGAERDLHSHWRDSARDLITAAILHLLHGEEPATLHGLVSFLSTPGLDQRQILERMLVGRHDPAFAHNWRDPLSGRPSPTHPEVASLAQSLHSRAERELSGVFSSALTYLSAYRDPILAANTSASDFRLSDLRGHARPVSLYLTTPPSELERVRPYFRLLLAQALRYLTRELGPGGGGPAGPRPLLLLIDEFPLLGRMGILTQALGILRGYGVRACLVVQDYSQIAKTYTRRQEPEAILAMCDTAVTFTTNDAASAEHFSRLAGVRTVRQRKKDRRAGSLAAGTIRHQEHQRPLLYPDEIRRLPTSELLILARGTQPIRGRWVRYWEDRELARRARIPPPAVSDVLAGGEGEGTGAPGT